MLALVAIVLALAQPPAAPAPPAGAARPVEPALAPAEALVSTQRGTIPVILTAPHGGMIRVPGSADRKSGVTVRDVNTGQVALLVGQRLTERLGGKPYFVIAQFSRKDADANRGPGPEAYENDAARAHYDAFHAAIAAAVAECREKHGVAILIDLHGQVRVPEAIVRGTRNGKTVAGLLKRHGRAALTGPDSIAGRLAAAGIKMVPDPEADEPEQGIGRETFFDGGYIVAQYGSQNENGVDAIQLEIGSQRSNDLLGVSRRIADAIGACFDAFVRPDCKAGSLPPKPPQPTPTPPPSSAPLAPKAPSKPPVPAGTPGPTPDKDEP